MNQPKTLGIIHAVNLTIRAMQPFIEQYLPDVSVMHLCDDTIQRGRSLDFSRKLALGASAAVMPLIFFVTQSPVQIAIVLFSIAFAGQQSWSTLVMILPADIFPHRAVGSVAGLVGFGGAMGGVVFGLVVGYLLDHGFGYGVVFAIVSTLHVIAFCVILLAVRVVQPIEAGVHAEI